MTDGWFELSTEGSLVIWEGVCAIRHHNHVTLLKRTKYGVVQIVTVAPPDVNITSDGYWTCAELTGKMSSGESYHFHAIDPQNAITLLRVACPDRLQSLTIRLDPDPLRLKDITATSERIDSWMRIRYLLKPLEFHLLFDNNMPM
ncbi:hypothetical protein QR680_001536 [Steinernema hermaphroditum]|uniref:Uncharacterized protein n=1 Tax=Steinernema hermaphroditum TaxID=289476 RepID=A0AA39LGB0_9BILA|nr:hypothetical protein QR680_001536 [Steinernema hermaphroditum]